MGYDFINIERKFIKKNNIFLIRILFIYLFVVNVFASYSLYFSSNAFGDIDAMSPVISGSLVP